MTTNATRRTVPSLTLPSRFELVPSVVFELEDREGKRDGMNTNPTMRAAIMRSEMRTAEPTFLALSNAITFPDAQDNAVHPPTWKHTNLSPRRGSRTEPPAPNS
jgi:hypothetical protein